MTLSAKHLPKSTRTLRGAFHVLVGCGLLVAGCSTETPDSTTEPILVFAAADLQLALAEVATQYEEATGGSVSLVFGSTGNLATQIQNGAPADVFFAADQSFLDRLSSAGMIEEDSRAAYAIGRLALVWSTSVPTPTDLSDLAAPAYRLVAIANPEHAPYGIAAQQAFETLGIWDTVSPKLVLGENISQTYQLVRTANADAGVVALGLLMGPEEREHLLIPDSLHAPLRQAAAVIKGSRSAGRGGEFLHYVVGVEGQAILERYGFGSP